MQDTEAQLFSEAVTVWQLDQDSVMDAAAAFWSNSIFGGITDKNERVAKHVQSGTTSRWIRELPRAVGKLYAEQFGDDLIALGYEKDNSWVDVLPEIATPFTIKSPSGEATITLH